MQTKSPDLFEYLQERIGCMYISDLPEIVRKTPSLIYDALISFQPSDYPRNVWNDALTFLTHIPAQENVEKAYSALITALFEKNSEE